MPPLQLNRRLVVCSSDLVAIIDEAGFTLIFMVALLDKPPGSVALTVKLFSPSSAESGVPDSEPLLATLNHAGPLSFPKVMLSPFGSVAFVETVPEYACPAVAVGSLNGLVIKTGGRFETAA